MSAGIARWVLAGGHPMRRGAIAAAALLVGCASVDGSLTVEGEPVALDRCASAVPLGFEGVDLSFEDGRVLRLFREGTTISDVGFFDDPTSSEGFLVGACATGEIRDTSSSTNDVVDLEGEATLDCIDPLAISGSVTFSGCH